MAVPPIRYTFIDNDTNMLHYARYDTEAQAQSALDDMDNPSDHSIVQVRDQVTPEIS